MRLKIEYFFIYFLFRIRNKNYVNCLDNLFKSNWNSNDKIEVNLNFTNEDKNEGCTGSVEQKLINGEQIFKTNNLIRKSEINERRFLSIKNHIYREFRIYFFKSSNSISNDFYKILFECAEASSAKPYLIDICVKKYFKKYNIEFSSTCLSCFSNFIGCGFISCNEQCSVDQCNSECKTCSEKNCFKKLLNCTKLDKLPSPCK
ncbi:conserved Plasmodium protein, unknown function [Plasmodium gallinaceum]|uniref:Uncharacterized protein n=1 Tax=Plasmodium gallinaceum TaxID=5849 RepID=A0A1J1H3D8_PLAGA|nr:conserved Plasmodium protein, unknown function [Plasmodium gallinaceum]CRG98007.1 conserved Plasmodium protein, unknown function [Plasmodium gallinaceum]